MIPAARHAGSTTRGFVLVCVLGCALAAAAGSAFGQTPSAAAAPSTAAPSAPGYGTIAGLVVDSLNGGALAGAQVSVEGLNVLAMTDSNGRFRIDSVPPGKYRIGIFHPLLDSLALSIASAPFKVAADSVLEVVIGVPSAISYVHLVCGNIQIDTMNGIGPSVLVGRVLDAETEEPRSHATVALSWIDIQVGTSIGLRRIQRVRDTTTGPGGEFRFCHLPAQLNGTARAFSSASDSGAVSRPYALNGRLIGTVVLHLPGSPLQHDQPVASANGAPTAAAGSILTGRVIGSDGSGPFVGAQVTVRGSSEIAVTGDSGQFTLRGLSAGSRTLEVHALGWEPVTMPVDLAQREPRQVTVPLEVKTAVLRAVIVTATLKAGLQRVGFASRQHMGIGQFLTPDDIAKRNPFEFVDLMAGMTGLVRRPGPSGDDYLAATRGMGSCVRYVVDGSPYQEMSPGDINTFVRPDDIGAVEVYQPSESPAQYAYSPPPMPAGSQTFGRMGTGSRRAGTSGGSGGSGGGTGCMKIIIWTKARLGL
jgi:Carboxypeptidase regulatory-like domain